MYDWKGLWIAEGFTQRCHGSEVVQKSCGNVLRNGGYTSELSDPDVSHIIFLFSFGRDYTQRHWLSNALALLS